MSGYPGYPPPGGPPIGLGGPPGGPPGGFNQQWQGPPPGPWMQGHPAWNPRQEPPPPPDNRGGNVFPYFFGLKNCPRNFNQNITP
jgi:hypothetical protein